MRTRIPQPRPRARKRIPTALLIALGSVVVLAGAPNSGGAIEQAPKYNAKIQRTSYGIPHIQAGDWGSLGYGYGYAFAEDNLCMVSRFLFSSSWVSHSGSLIR